MTANAADRLLDYFTRNVGSYRFAETVGIEIETQFLDSGGCPIGASVSQAILARLCESGKWQIAARRGGMITEVSSDRGRILY